MRSYQHHIGDFNNATRHLDRLERSIYRDLIELYYDIEGPLPLDIQTICRRILARSNEESTVVERSLNEFFTETPTGWYHNRCEAEIEKYRNSNSQRALAGKASAAKKALKKQQALNGNSTGVEIPLNGDSTIPQNHKPVTINHKPISPSPEAQEDDRLARWMFDLIVQAVPGTKEPKLDKWANTIRLMRERDHLTHRQIAEVFLWANRDPFWKTNILSPDKLREKFPQLAAKSQEAPHAARNQPARQTASDKVNAALDAAFGSSSTGIVLEADFDRIDPHETAGCRSGSVSSVV